MESQTKLVVLGCRGDGLVAFEIARALPSVEVVGFLDDSMPVGSFVQGVPVLGGLRSWSELSFDLKFHPCLHKVGEMKGRSTLINSLGIPHDRFFNLIHPSSVIAKDVVLGVGVMVASCVTIQPNVVLSNFCTVRAGANIGHDAIVAEFCYVGPNATLCGCAELGAGVHIGPNAVVLERLKVGGFAIIGAGGVLIKDAPDISVWLGNPARKIR